MSAVTTFPAEPEPAARWHHAAVSRETCAQLTLGIVHEMNNLTGGIAVLSELYTQEAATGMPVSEGLELIGKSTARLQALVRHLKIVHGPLREAPTYVDLQGFVHGTMDLLAPVLPKNIVVTTDFPPDGELAAHLDEAILRQALLDVLLNVRDALLTRRTDGGHSLRVSLRRTAVARAELVLAAAHEDGAGLADPPEGPRWSESKTRWHHAAGALQELDGRLTRGAHGEFILELPLAD